MHYEGKTILVVGAGRSGLAAADFLLDQGARVILTDTKDRSAFENRTDRLIESLFANGMLKLELGGHQAESFKQCDFVVVSPGVPLALPEFDLSRKSGIPVIAEIELGFRHLQGTIIGISGSNGKTTTTTLVAALLKGAGIKVFEAGNIGKPLTSFVPSSSPGDFYVVELSSFQLEGIHEFRPQIGSILNITPDHMDRYENFERYADTKRRMFLNQKQNDYAVLNADDSVTAAMASRIISTAVLFSRRHSLPHGAFVRDDRIVYRDFERETILFPVSAIPLMGVHNIENVLAACTIAVLAGATPESLEESVRKFRGVEHRIEFVAEINGVRYYNDSKATNVAAAVKSMESFPGNIWLIAGGRDKGGDFSLMRESLQQRVKHLILIGEAADAIRKASGKEVETAEAGTMQEAVDLCRKQAQKGDIVLLAPACASFDMFRDYEHRGHVFKDAVLGMLH